MGGYQAWIVELLEREQVSRAARAARAELPEQGLLELPEQDLGRPRDGKTKRGGGGVV